MSHQKSPNTEKCPLKEFLQELNRVESWREEATWKEAVAYERGIIEVAIEIGVQEEAKKHIIKDSRKALVDFLL